VDHAIIHVVKRFGRVGGMESYVWHLVHGLANQGEEIIVVCEAVFEAPEEGIQVILVGPTPERPRWRSMLMFRTKVNEVLSTQLAGKPVIVHSHERSLNHQVTTFHGPPIKMAGRWDLLGRLNPRLNAWRSMEKEELTSPSVKVILPVSSLIQDSLMARYNFRSDQSIQLAWPGVESSLLNQLGKSQCRSNGAKMVFVGKEWKRKGLDHAVEVVREYRRLKGSATLAIYGASPDLLPGYITRLEWVDCRGWGTTIPWHEFDILIHPAREEPFGMVISEARSHGIPVLMSTNVGAVDLRFSCAQAIALQEPLIKWAESASWLLKLEKKAEIKWGWSDLVAKHRSSIYTALCPVVF
jgi:UDP-glucose:(heptosyl)LPS alpha-1,3-glucosyltransferase